MDNVEETTSANNMRVKVKSIVVEMSIVKKETVNNHLQQSRVESTMKPSQHDFSHDINK